jgi:thiosulfate dehydrogenase [quinone] large subunit
MTVSSNPLDILLGVIILTAGLNPGRIGFDRWVIQFLRKFTRKEDHTVNPMKHSA